MGIIFQHMPNLTTTAESPVSKTRDEVIKEAKRIEEGTLYSSKGHFNASALWRRLQYWLGIPATILAAVAAASAFAQLDKGNTLAGWMSIIVAALSGLTTFLNPQERAANHFEAANQYDALHNKARIFWTIDCLGNDSDLMLTNRLKELSEEKNALNKQSPQIFKWAYALAKRGIAAGEGSYSVDRLEKQKGPLDGSGPA